ncbi:hypothetical protein OROHE_007112 [Orobanche hederae]
MSSSKRSWGPYWRIRKYLHEGRATTTFAKAMPVGRAIKVDQGAAVEDEGEVEKGNMMLRQHLLLGMVGGIRDSRESKLEEVIFFCLC